MKKTVNLIFFRDGSRNGNFGDELSRVVVNGLLNKKKYKLVFNEDNEGLNVMGIGSYIHRAVDNSYIYGSGVRTDPPREGGHNYRNLNVCAVRGPLTKEVLEKKSIDVPDIFGDPALLLPKLFKPKIDKQLKNKIGLVPHKSNYERHKNANAGDLFHLISPTDKWEDVVSKICSCKGVVSSSLHGLICSDAYCIPNLWLEQYELEEGEFKFRDYFLSQSRSLVKIRDIKEYSQNLLYNKGNTIDLSKLEEAYPFK